MKHLKRKNKHLLIKKGRIISLILSRHLSLGIIISLILISVTSIPTYSLLSNTFSMDITADGGNHLNIENGNDTLSLDNTAETAWKSISPIIPTVANNTITDPSSGQEVDYGPVYLMTPSDSLTSNVNLQIQYILKKSGGTTENVNNAPGSTLVEPFEVFVGDMDNFNIGVDSSYDFYSGTTTTEHSINVYPQSYDAQGTDRRMVPSGFYQIGTQIFTKVDSSDAQKGLKLPSINSTCTSYSSGAYYGVRLNSPATVDGVTLPQNLDIFYDGYTDRAISGTYQSGSAAADDIIDGVNWRYLQRVKPITFKYDSISDKYGISSVSFQFFTDDMQSGSANNSTEFASVSGSYFNVYLSDGTNQIEVPEFADVLNRFAQSGPVGNMISLNLPEEYFSIIKSASGLGHGLQLLIDDTRIGNSGDSFCIDFAKMTVNKEAAKGSSNNITINGKVVDKNSNPISGVKVTTGDGKSAITASDGTYTISGADPGLLSLTFSHEKYKTAVFMYGNATKGSTIDLVSNNSNWQVLYMGLKSEIIANEKLSVSATIQKCDLNGTPIAGESPIGLNSSDLNSSSDYKIINTNGSGTIVNQSIQLKNLSPNSRYKITYKLYLRSYDDIGDIAKFDLLFSSRIRAKSTQESNPRWDEDSSGSEYTTSVTENGSIPMSPNVNETASNSKIYFERPNTSSYWSDFSTGPVPYFYLNNTTPLTNSGNITKFTDGSDWYKYTFDNNSAITENSYIKISDSADTTRTSGKLYYFSTQKIFICTN